MTHQTQKEGELQTNVSQCDNLQKKTLKVDNEQQVLKNETVSHTIYDNSDCAWLHETLGCFKMEDERTYDKPDRPYVTFNISESQVQG